MQPFPVSSSILSAPHLAQFLRETYNLSANVTCQLLKAGINHSYLVTSDSDKFVFRLYSLNWRTREEISEEIALLKRVKAGGVPVSYPLPNANG